jgi:hypothetical protein
MLLGQVLSNSQPKDCEGRGKSMSDFKWEWRNGFPDCREPTLRYGHKLRRMPALRVRPANHVRVAFAYFRRVLRERIFKQRSTCLPIR